MPDTSTPATGGNDDFKPTLPSAIRYLRELISDDEERAEDPQRHIMYGTQGRALLKLAADYLQGIVIEGSVAQHRERRQ